MLIEDQHPDNKNIMIALVGRPNAGKSTLINHLLGFDLSIVSDKPQTTRNNFHCVFTIDKTEVVLVDTPGIHTSNQELNIRMNGQAIHGSEGADLNLILLDLTSDMVRDIKSITKTFENLGRSWVVFTKVDLIDKSKVDIHKIIAAVQALLPNVEKFFSISSTEGTNIHELTGEICDAAMPGPHFYSRGAVSNKNERFFATEYIREQAFNILKDELPYELAVVIEDYQDAFESHDGKKLDAKISASILVNRPSQRAIVVGRQGSVIKEIGSGARKKIEAMLGARAHLNLHVKVSPKWFKNNYVLDEIGLPRTRQSNRVWRKR